MQYKTRYINEIVRTYYIEVKEALSRPGRMDMKRAITLSRYYLFLINRLFRYSRYDLTEFMKYHVHYTACELYQGRKLKEILGKVNGAGPKTIVTLLYPFSKAYCKKNFVRVTPVVNKKKAGR